MKIKYFFVYALILTWLTLSAQIEVFYLLMGVLSIIITVIITKYLHKNSSMFFSPATINGKGIKFFLWLIKEITITSFQLAKQVYMPIIKIKPKTFWLPFNSNMSDTKQVIYALSITLTPGTICFEIEENKMLIHSLSEENISFLQSKMLENMIQQM